jgi:hypothetical protein
VGANGGERRRGLSLLQKEGGGLRRLVVKSAVWENRPTQERGESEGWGEL